jgi:uncharacterized protein
MNSSQQVIEQTKNWINKVVVGCNFCPFASKVMKQQTVYYRVEESDASEVCLEVLLDEILRLDYEQHIETSFLILPNAVKQFEDYLTLVDVAEKLIRQKGYEGIYQLASFHPLYRFAGTDDNDAANFTNRSLYPMLHLLREESIEKALQNYKEPETIPEQNIHFAREKGLVYMKMLRDACFSS